VNIASPLVVNMKVMEQHVQMIRVHLSRSARAASAMVLFAMKSQRHTANCSVEYLMVLILFAKMLLAFQKYSLAHVASKPFAQSYKQTSVLPIMAHISVVELHVN